MKFLWEGILTMVGFFILTMVMGDKFTILHHSSTYTGLILLSGIIVVCTRIILSKIDELKDLIERNTNK